MCMRGMGLEARQERQREEGARREGHDAGVSLDAAEPDRARPAPAGRHRRPSARRSGAGAARRRARLRRHRQGLALQRPPVRVRPADPVPRLCRGDRAPAAPHLRPRAAAVAQAAWTSPSSSRRSTSCRAASSSSAAASATAMSSSRRSACRAQGWARRFEECLEAIRRLWTEDFVTMKGSHFELDRANCTVKPLQKPTPPDLDRRQCRCRDPPRRAAWRLLVHQPAQHAVDDRAPDGPLQARARRVRQSRSRANCRCAARSLSRRPAPRRSAAPSPTSKRNTGPIAPGVRTR